MKTTMDYMVGNTAIQIVNTGKRIKIVDVEKEELLDRHVYQLQTQVSALEKENVILQRQGEEIAVNYNEIFKKAKGLGMRFPTNQQLETYTMEKSTAVRVGRYIK